MIETGRFLMPKGSLPSGLLAVLFLIALTGCATQASPSSNPASNSSVDAVAPATSHAIKVVAAETYLADIAQNVAGNRTKVSALMPIGVDIHEFEPTPGDIAKVADSNLFIITGAGLEEFLDKIIANNSKQPMIEASAGIASRIPREGEPKDEDNPKDPHFWLDPNNVITYTMNIRDGLSKADPAGANFYAANTEAYIKQLRELDSWVAEQVEQVPPTQRLLVTNHESFGYYADRYGFMIVGAIIPSIGTGATPSAQELVRLINQIKSTDARAIFLETGSNQQLAQQVAKEAGVKTVTQLYTHSITDAAGVAPSYIEMITYNTKAIVEALK